MNYDDMLRLSKAGYTLDATGQAVGAGLEFASGLQFADAASFQASQLRQGANAALATSQRQAVDQDRQTQLITSRALAVAAASGGGASDPGVVSIIARDAQEGAYRRQVALYQGEDRARALNLAADVKGYEGRSAAVNSGISAAGQIFSAGTTLMKGQIKDSSLKLRFGMGAPGES